MKLIRHPQNPILKPEKPYEKKGMVDNVTFPEGAVLVPSYRSKVTSYTLLIYYGAADRVIGVAKINLKELTASLKEN